MAGRDFGSESERAPDNDAPRRATAPAKEAGATSAGTGTAPARAAAPDATRPPDAASLGARQVKAKMVTGAAADPAEREADRAADHVMRVAAPEQNRPSAVDPTVADASSRGPGRATSVPPGPQRTVAGTAPGPATGTTPGPATGTAPGPAAGTAPEPVRRQAVADHDPHGGKEVPEETQRYLDRSQGTGGPLPDGTRRYFEDRFSADFGGVRVHDGDEADRAARSIGALAFTRGSDIWFSAGAYDPVTDDGRRLLAHELAHIAQQYPGIGRQADDRVGAVAAPAAGNPPAAGGPMIGRAERGTAAGRESKTPPPALSRTAAPGAGGAVIRRATEPSAAKKGAGPAPGGSISGKKITIDKLRVPEFKVQRSGQGPFTLRKGTRDDNPTKQASFWRNKVKDNVQASVTARIKQLRETPNATQAGDPAYYLQLGRQPYYLIGTESSIANDIRVPAWDKKGNFRSFDIDHKREAQLGGDDDFPTGNLWLLDSSKNRSSGSTIKRNIDTTLGAFLRDTAPQKIDPSQVPAEEEVRRPDSGWTVDFAELVGEEPGADPVEWWEASDLALDKNDLLKSVKFASPKVAERLRGSPTKLSIFDRASGGGLRQIDRKGDETRITDWDAGVFKITSVIFTEDDVGKGSGRLEGTAFSNSPNSPIESAPFKVPIKKLSGVQWGGVATPGAIDYWRARAFSPVSFPEPGFDVKKGIVGRGSIAKPDVKLLENVDFAVVLDGDVRIEATVVGGDLALPGPLKVRGGSITLSAGLSGIGVTGDIQFEIEKLAKGHIGAGARAGSRSPALWLDGELDFDTKMFTKAQLGLSYKDGKWGVKGELAVGPDKIKGIKRASAKVDVKDDTVTADGEFETSLKGVDKGKLSFRYNQAAGMEIAGEIILGKGIPGIKSGKLDATVKEGPTGHSLSGGVTLEPSVPGLTGTVTGKYEDGAFLVEADLGYEKDLAKGSVKVGLTNQAPGPDGKPTGPPKPDGSLTLYGGGTVTLTLTPWLQGTVGLKLTERGEIEVSGEVALPSAFEVFKERTLEKQLLSIGVDIPIIGVAVAGQRIGIFATVRGGVSISAGFGPGELRDVALKVTYDPARPDDTTVSGRGNFVVPAHAGLRLSVGGELGAGIPVVSATAGLTVYGEIGVAGAASAGVVVDWTPRSGIILDARGAIFVEPKFKFGVDAFVDVSADLWVTTIELYHKKWKLADFEYGSNLRFGLSVPVHYESGKPFDISFDQIQWTYPHIEPTELLGGLMKQLVG
jgi:Domain of unknown function (DUF4157)